MGALPEIRDWSWVDIFIKPFNCKAQNHEQLSSTVSHRQKMFEESRRTANHHTYKSRWKEGDSMAKGQQVNWTSEKRKQWDLATLKLCPDSTGGGVCKTVLLKLWFLNSLCPDRRQALTVLNCGSHSYLNFKKSSTLKNMMKPQYHTHRLIGVLRGILSTYSFYL